MRLSTQGLADGFLNGFRTMADYQSQQKADARADKSLSLQEQQIKDGNYQWKQTFDHTVEQDKSTNTREDRRLTKQETDADRNYILARDKNKSDIANDGARTSASVAASNASVAASKAQTETDQYKLKREKQQQWLTENHALLVGGLRNLSEKKPLTEPQRIALSSENAESLSFNKLVDPTIRQNAVQLRDNIRAIQQNFDPKNFHSQGFYNQINSPQIVEGLNSVYKDQANKNINYKDETGKLVVGKKIHSVTPTQNGGFALDLQPIYEDGSVGDVKPVTENRSTDKGDKVLVIAPQDFVGSITGLANAYESVDPEYVKQYMVDSGIAPAADLKGFAEKAAEVDKGTQSSMAAALKAYQGGTGTDGANIETRLSEIKAQGEKTKETLARGYGLSDVAYDQLTGDKSGGGNTQQALITNWLGSDPKKQEFFQRGVSAGKIDPKTTDSVELDNAYQMALKAQQAKELEQKAMSMGSAAYRSYR